MGFAAFVSTKLVAVGCSSCGGGAGASSGVEDVSEDCTGYIGKGYIGYIGEGCCRIGD
jgi:hypothetical protein